MLYHNDLSWWYAIMICHDIASWHIMMLYQSGIPTWYMSMKALIYICSCRVCLALGQIWSLEISGGCRVSGSSYLILTLARAAVATIGLSLHVLLHAGSLSCTHQIRSCMEATSMCGPWLGYCQNHSHFYSRNERCMQRRLVVRVSRSSSGLALDHNSSG